ncbi:MAG: hypothetical protein ACM3KR_03000 [Deltaproteobacteria bacterium]
MNENFVNQLMGMLSNMEDKKMSQSVNKAIEILKNHDINDIKSAIINQDFSKISEAPSNINFDIGKIIDALPDSKKKIIIEKFNSPDFQDILKTDRNKAIQILMQSISE